MAPSLTTTTTIAPCSSLNGLRSNDLRLPSGVSELCHYPPLIHRCGSRGSSCCAATVSTTHRLNCQPTSNDVSSSSKAWSHVYSQRKKKCSKYMNIFTAPHLACATVKMLQSYSLHLHQPSIHNAPVDFLSIGYSRTFFFSPCFRVNCRTTDLYFHMRQPKTGVRDRLFWMVNRDIITP